MAGSLPAPGALLLGLALCGTLLVARPAESRETRAPRAMLREIEQSAATIRLDLRAARAEGDLRRARCLSSKLSEVHAQQRLAEHHATDLGASRDSKSARRFRYLLETAAEYSHEITAQARRCGAPRTSARRVIAPAPRVAVQRPAPRIALQ